MESVDLSSYVPEFEIAIDNYGSSKLKEDLRNSTFSVTINEQIGGNPAQFSITLADYSDRSRQNFFWLEKFFSDDSPIFDIDKKINIKMGYVGNLKKIITGNINSISTSGFSNDMSTLTLTGYDSSHKYLTDRSIGNEEGSSKQNITIERNDTYSSIAGKIADISGLKKEIDPTKLYNPVILRKSVTYIDFLSYLATRVGYEFFISRGTLFFVDPRKERYKDGNTLILKRTENLMEFSPSIDTANIIPSVEIRGNLPDSRKVIIKETSPGDEDVVEEGRTTASQIATKLKNKKLEIVDKIFYTEEEALDIAKAQLNIISDNLVTGSGVITGNPNITIGQHIVIEDVGKLLSGKYYVTSVTNIIDNSGYITRFNARKNVI